MTPKSKAEELAEQLVKIMVDVPDKYPHVEQFKNAIVALLEAALQDARDDASNAKFEAVAEQARLDERERCIQILCKHINQTRYDDHPVNRLLEKIAKAIREGGK